MAQDYTQNVIFTPKDALPTTDPNKLILGVELDAELAEIATAIACKFDSSDIASQAQAEAGTSNEVLMTPLRVSQFLGGGGGGGGGTAGALPDILALDDPGDDRIMYWDDVANNIDWLDLSNEFAIAANTLSLNLANISHDALADFVADEHVAHSSVIPTAGEGLALTLSGTGIEAAFDYAMDVSSLTSVLIGAVDAANDTVLFYDASANDHKRIPINEISGDQLGDGKWFRSGNVALVTSADTDIVYNTQVYDSLSKGTFNTVTGEYTCNSDGTRIWVSAQCHVQNIGEGRQVEIFIRKNGSNIARGLNVSLEGFGGTSWTPETGTNIDLDDTDVISVVVNSNATSPLLIGSDAFTILSIIELA